MDKSLDKETVWKISGTDENAVYQYGNDMDGLKRIADHYGFESEYIENMQIADVENFLSRGTLVVLNVGKKNEGTHALLVIGYDKNKKLFYINDPANEKNKVLKYSDLKNMWFAHLSSPRRKSYRSGFVVYPKKLDNSNNEVS